MPTSALHKIRPRRADFMDIANGCYEIIPIEEIISLGPMWASAPTGTQLNDNFSAGKQKNPRSEDRGFVLP